MANCVLSLLLQHCCFGRCLLRYSMTTAVSAHLVVLANENGGGFNVQPGQQQAGGNIRARPQDDNSTNGFGECILYLQTRGLTVSLFPPLPCQGLAQDILSDLVEDACLGLCFEVHRAVKQGYFFLDDTDQESMRDFGERWVFSVSLVKQSSQHFITSG